MNRILINSSFSFLKKIKLSKIYYNHYRFINKLLFLSCSASFFYMLSKENKISNRLKKYALKPFNIIAQDILTSKEVKGNSIDLLEDLFKDKYVLDSIVFSLNKSLKDNDFKSKISEFSKILVLKTLKEKNFLNETNKNIIKVLKSEEIIKQSVILSKEIKDDYIFKDEIAKFCKYLFSSNPVLESLVQALQKCGMNASVSDDIKDLYVKTSLKVFDDSELKRFLYLKSIDLFSIMSSDIIKGKNEDLKTNEKTDLLKELNKL